MGSFLALLAWLAQASVAAEHVRIPGPDGVMLDAALVRPTGPIVAPAVVALHGCGGPYPLRDGSWAALLAARGHIVLLPDSFGSRGLGSQCRAKHRTVGPGGVRRQDAVAAGQWLAAQPETPEGGLVLMGWSNGGSTTLAVAATDENRPASPFSRFVAFYPGCARAARNAAWRPSGPLLVLIGESDDWTPAAPCRDLAARIPTEMTLVTFPGAYHDFDAPGVPVRVLTGLATTPSGTAHAGGNPEARAAAVPRALSFIEQAPAQP